MDSALPEGQALLTFAFSGTAVDLFRKSFLPSSCPEPGLVSETLGKGLEKNDHI